MPSMTDATQPEKVREVKDIIFALQSEATPLLSMLRQDNTPSNQMLLEMMFYKQGVRSLRGTMDGTDYTQFNKETRVPGAVYAMIQDEPYGVSYLAQLNRTYGGIRQRQEFKWQKVKGMLMLKLVMERTIGSDMPDQAQTGAADPYQTRGLFEWIKASAQTVNPVPEDFRPASAQIYTGALASFTDTSLETMIKAAATTKRGAVNYVAPCGPDVKSQMSNWTQRDTEVSTTIESLTRYTVNKADKKLIKPVDTFEFDFGTVRNWLSYDLLCDLDTGEATAKTPTSALFLEPGKCHLRVRDKMHTVKVNDDGGGPREAARITYAIVNEMPGLDCAINPA